MDVRAPCAKIGQGRIDEGRGQRGTSQERAARLAAAGKRSADYSSGQGSRGSRRRRVERGHQKRAHQAFVERALAAKNLIDPAAATRLDETKQAQMIAGAHVARAPSRIEDPPWDRSIVRAQRPRGAVT